jgi:hypothetical protein
VITSVVVDKEIYFTKANLQNYRQCPALKLNEVYSINSIASSVNMMYGHNLLKLTISLCMIFGKCIVFVH